jgi:hypothetical protein
LDQMWLAILSAKFIINQLTALLNFYQRFDYN